MGFTIGGGEVYVLLESFQVVATLGKYYHNYDYLRMLQMLNSI